MTMFKVTGCLNYDSKMQDWVKIPEEFKNLGCFSCTSHYNSLIVANKGTQAYVDEVTKLMKEQEAFSGVRRTLKTDYVKNKAWVEADKAATWSNPNMETFSSLNGYVKLCASFAMKISRAAENGEKLTKLG